LQPVDGGGDSGRTGTPPRGLTASRGLSDDRSSSTGGGGSGRCWRDLGGSGGAAAAWGPGRDGRR